MRRRPLLVAVSLALTALALLAAPASAGAAPRPAAGSGGGAVVTATGQQPDAPADDGTGGSADDSEEPVPVEDIIPEPNSGRAPEDAGDRGGALQILVFLLIVVSVGGGVATMVRESRRSRARRP